MTVFGHGRRLAASTLLLLSLLFTSRALPARAQPASGGDRAATGREVPELEAVEAAMQRFLSERSVGAATLVVVHQGQVCLERGYGFRDLDRKVPVEPGTPFRIASLVKPITAAAIRRLASTRELDLEARVVELLDIKPPRGGTFDPRWEQITINHLLEHKGGWDRDAAGDIMFRAGLVKRELGLSRLARPADIVLYMEGQPLQFDPGSRSCYSNFGYCVLGRVIEKVSGKPYVRFIQEDLLRPIGVDSVELGHSRPADRNRLEPSYRTKERGTSVFSSRNAPPPVVPLCDGGFYLEAMDSHGGLICSAIDYARFLTAYHVDGRPCVRPSRGYDETFFGSLPGTWTMGTRMPDGTVIVAFCNQRDDPSGLPYEPIKDVLRQAVQQISEWPEGEPVLRRAIPGETGTEAAKDEP